MKTTKKIILLLLAVVTLTFSFTGCGKDNTVEQYIVANEQYTQKSDLEGAVQPDKLAAGQEVFASVYFIESPKGMGYTAKWSMNSKEIKTETKEMSTDKNGIIVFSLEANKATIGALKLEILYKDDVLCSKELAVQ